VSKPEPGTELDEGAKGEAALERSPSLAALIEGLRDVRARAREVGVFLDDRPLLSCPACGLIEDVSIEGVLITSRDSALGVDTGLRFVERRGGGAGFGCPACGADAVPDQGERWTEAEMDGIPHEYRGWWLIIDTEKWSSARLDILGPALLSLTGEDDRLRMHCLLAQVDAFGTESGVSFTWRGAWEFDQMSGRGSVRLLADGRLTGELAIENGDSSAFTAERARPPHRPIPDPPSYRDKWRRW
jgi:hypothetical protein